MEKMREWVWLTNTILKCFGPERRYDDNDGDDEVENGSEGNVEIYAPW